MEDSKSFKVKARITGRTSAAGNTKDIEFVVPLKYLRNVLRTLEILSINCEVNLISTNFLMVRELPCY